MTTYNIVEYGAQPESRDYARNAEAIQSAINDASANGGGVVFVPQGTFYSACLELKSNVTLFLTYGAKLIASPDYSDYAPSLQDSPWAPMPGIPLLAADKLFAFIRAEYAENVSIRGEGEIDGQGMNRIHFPNPEDPLGRRPHLILFHHCRDILVSSLTLSNPAFFTCFSVMCRNIAISNLRIHSRFTENGDGIDLDGCENVDIGGCMIDSGDDAVSLKTTDPEWPCRNIHIRDCRFSTVWGGVRFGTESSADMKDVCVEKCVFWDCNDAIKVQDCSTGTYSNLQFSDCVMHNVHRPFFVTLSRFRLSKKDASIRPKLGGIKDVRFSGIVADLAPHGEQSERNCMVVSGCPNAAIENISFEDIELYLHEDHAEEGLNRAYVPEYLDYSFLYADIFSINGYMPCCGPYLRHVDGISFKNVRLIQLGKDPRPAFYGYDVRNAELSGVFVSDGIPGFFKGVDTDASFNDCYLGNESIEAVDDLSDEERMQYGELCRDSRMVNVLFDDYSALIDDAQRMENSRSIQEEEWTKDSNTFCAAAQIGNPSRCIVTIPLFGTAKLFCNDAPAGECRLPEGYRGLVLWPCDITRYLKDEKVSLKLVWENPTERGGIDCKLPFGAFSPFSCGVHGLTTLYWED